MHTLLRIRGADIRWEPEAGRISFGGGMTIDADGAYRAYHRDNARALDFLANAGRPGNWWGIATDKGGKPVIQGPNDPAPGYYVSPTAYMHRGYPKTSPLAYLDSETVRFVVIPGPLKKMVPPKFLGCHARVTYNGKTVDAVVGDIGPATHLGEGSIALAQALGIPSNPKTGGVDAGVFYEIWPGRPALVDGVKYRLQ